MKEQLLVDAIERGVLLALSEFFLCSILAVLIGWGGFRLLLRLVESYRMARNKRRPWK